MLMVVTNRVLMLKMVSVYHLERKKLEGIMVMKRFGSRNRLNVADALDRDGDLKVSMGFAVSGYGGDVTDWLSRAEAKRLIRHLKKVWRIK